MSTGRAKETRRGRASRDSDNPEAKRFVQIKTVVMMSDAWRDCDYSTRSAFLELSARLKWASGQSEPINNGRLWLSRSEWERAGFASATITRAMKQLIKVGLLYRTRSGGISRGCSEYGITCYPLAKDTSGLFCVGFRKDAWAKYVPQPATPEKPRASKLPRDRSKNDSLPPENGDKEIKSEQGTPTIFEHQEPESTTLHKSEVHHRNDDWIPAYFQRLTECGLAHACPVAIQ